MKFQTSIIILGVLAASPAHACVQWEGAPSSDDLRALQTLSERIERETEIKSQIDASVWGVFLDSPSKGLQETGYARFKVSRISKGTLSEIIHVVTTRRDVKLGTEIHMLNLRKIDKSRWTDVGVTQQALNWGAEACEIEPDSSRCKLHRIESGQLKEQCHAFIRETQYGCLASNAIPKMCNPYKNSLFESFTNR